MNICAVSEPLARRMRVLLALGVRHDLPGGDGARGDVIGGACARGGDRPLYESPRRTRAACKESTSVGIFAGAFGAGPLAAVRTAVVA